MEISEKKNNAAYALNLCTRSRSEDRISIMHQGIYLRKIEVPESFHYFPWTYMSTSFLKKLEEFYKIGISTCCIERVTDSERLLI